MVLPCFIQNQVIFTFLLDFREDLQFLISGSGRKPQRKELVITLAAKNY